MPLMNTNRQVKKFQDETFLATRPVFTLEGLSVAMEGRSRSAVRSWVKYHLATGRLRLVERGVYAAVPPGIDAESFDPDPFLVGRVVRPDAVFSYHAALQLLGVAHSDWSVVSLFTERRRRALASNAWRIEFSLHPATLRKGGKETKGVEDVRYRGPPLRVTGPERTLVDGFHSPEKAGGLEELVVSAAGFASLDFQMLLEVLQAYDRKTLWAATGWFLEQYRHSLVVSNDLLRSLEKRIPLSPQYLPRHRRGQGGVLVRRWNLVLPEHVVALGEPDAG
ncbi:MAG: type IV toxin-antitoxin system AbiEi family antitoxin domain-containing protein [Gemmatimonadota bacterium]